MDFDVNLELEIYLKSSEKSWDFEVQNRKNREIKSIPKTMFFSTAFFN